MKPMKITEQDYIKACRKASREDEIAAYGKPLGPRHLVFRSKKQYNRQQMRNDTRSLVRQ